MHGQTKFIILLEVWLRHRGVGILRERQLHSDPGNQGTRKAPQAAEDALGFETLTTLLLTQLVI